MEKKDFTTKDITQPIAGYTVYRNNYWICKNGDITKALFYKDKYPQCNKNKAIIDWGWNKEIFDDCEAVYVEVAFVKSIN